MTTAKLRRLREMLETRDSYADIRAELDIAKSTINMWARRLGFPPRVTTRGGVVRLKYPIPDRHYRADWSEA
jgi:hypothetical protein